MPNTGRSRRGPKSKIRNPQSAIRNPQSKMSSPILDLSYRNYDGPLEPPYYRWWAIARVSIQSAFAKKSFWFLTILGGFWYVILMIMFYFADQSAGAFGSNGNAGIVDPAKASAALFSRVKWDELFLHAFSIGQLWFFIIALLIGIGTIANDNRANALLVYLSKPCTKLDYLIGKWVGIFVPMVIAVGIPTLFFYAYCFMSYRDYGFLDDPGLIVKLVVLIAIPAVFHASAALGISSMFKQGRVAGASYAGLYFFTLFFTKAMGGLHLGLAGQSGSTGLVDNLFYCSVDGIQIGLAKALLNTRGSHVLPLFSPGGDMDSLFVPAPNGLFVTLAFLVICGLFVLFASTRVRAVEVVS